MLPLLAIVASVTGLCSSTLPILQIHKMIRDRSAGGVSVVYLSGSLTNGFIWLAYGVVLGNIAIMLSNAVWIAMCSTMIVIAVKLRRRRAWPVPVHAVARAVAADPEVAAEFKALVAEHRASADTLVLRPREFATVC